MAILEKEVLIVVSGKTLKYYKEKGYDEAKVNKAILVKVEDLPEGSGIKLTKICDDCGGQSLPQTYQLIVKCRKRTDGKDRCRSCGGKYASMTKMENIDYENSLEFYAKNNGMEYLLEEFSEKNEKQPNEISYGSGVFYLWDCPEHHEFSMSIHNRTNGRQNCSICVGQKVLKGFNDLYTTHPEIAKALLDNNKGYEITHGSNKKEKFKCNECGHIEPRTIISITRQGYYNCRRCGDGIKYPEKFMISILNQIGTNYERGVTFKWSDNKIYDFYLETDGGVVIETHGEQHYKYTGRGRSLLEEQENDRLKEGLAFKNGIKKENYIVIDCRKSDLEWIKNSILESKLNDMFDLSKIDWMKAHEFATKTNSIKNSCALFNEGKSIIEIKRILRIKSRNTIRTYLKKGTEFGWCDYDPEEEKKKSARNNLKNTNKKVIQMSLNEDFIIEWESGNKAARELNLSQTMISRASRNGEIRYGFKWMFKSDYDNYIEQSKTKELIHI